MSGDYWPEGERFGVLGIGGYPDAAGLVDGLKRNHAKHSWHFWVVDLNRMGEEVRCFKGGGNTLRDPNVLAARARARRECDRLNALERKTAA